MLVCNFSRGLMEHDDVVTLFHEFGHLVHHVLAGRGEWVRFSGVATEWDFVEAPSQMLEEWAWDADVLQTFARNAAGEPIPADLVDADARGRRLRQGLSTPGTQMFYAAVSYWFHVTSGRPTSRRGCASCRTATRRSRYLDGHPHPAPLRPPRRLLLGVLHLHVVAGHRQGPVLAPSTADDLFDPEVAGALPRQGARAGRADATPPTWSRTSSAAPYTFDAYAAWLAR